MAFTGVCHCGAVTYEVAADPAWLTECNCSICRKLGTLWFHAPVSAVTLTAAPDATVQYSYGPEELVFQSCRTCGCTTHWSPAAKVDVDRMAVNARLASPEAIASLRIRHFDGADTWAFLD